MTKITNRAVEKSDEIYLCIYQAVTVTEETSNIYTQFSPDFFDLIIVANAIAQSPPSPAEPPPRPRC